MRFRLLKPRLFTLFIGSLVIYLYIRNLDAPSLLSYDEEDVAHAFNANSIPSHLPDNLLKYPPLHARGRHLLDAQGQDFQLASVNWYGASDELFIPSGLDIRHRTNISKLIRRLGFNSVRLAYSDEMVVTSPLIPSELLTANPDLFGLHALEVFVAVVESLTEEGIVVIPNNHITQATWCCGINPCDASWRNDHFFSVCRVTQSEDQWIENWERVMLPFVNNSLVAGADLRNEVRGLWGTMPWSSWATAAERAGNRLLAMNRHWIIIVEGTSSSNDLTGVRTRPVLLNVEDRVVYSVHVYGWSGWGSLGGPYAKRSYDSFRQSMDENWGFILEEDIAPVWVGEFGAPRAPIGKGDKNYWNNLMKYLREAQVGGGLGFAYWAINPRKPHEAEDEKYGLINDDWVSVVWDYRMRDLRDLIDG